ncbi:hypothetical protein [Maricaulis sp. CAU 1757]
MSEQSDLAYLKRVAEAGSTAPLLGGRFFIWWGGLASLALLAHWAVLVGAVPLARPQIGFIWLAYGLVGSAGMLVLARSLAGKPGSGSAANRGESAVWQAVTITIFAYAIGLVIAFLTERISDPVLFDTIPLIAFGLYGVAFKVVTRLGGPAWLGRLGWLAWVGMALGLSLLGTSWLYLYSAALVGTLAIIPGLALLRSEPAAEPV